MLGTEKEGIFGTGMYIKKERAWLFQTGLFWITWMGWRQEEHQEELNSCFC